jgi:hypothetical protein
MASNDCPIQFIYLSIYDMQTIFLVGHKTTLLNHPSVSLYFYFILLIKEPFIHLKTITTKFTLRTWLSSFFGLVGVRRVQQACSSMFISQ